MRHLIPVQKLTVQHKLVGFGGKKHPIVSIAPSADGTRFFVAYKNGIDLKTLTLYPSSNVAATLDRR